MKKSTQPSKTQKEFQIEYKAALKNIKWLSSKSNIKFSYLAGINRPTSPGHVTKLTKSYEVLGSLRPIIIAEISFLTGKKEKYIIDGQHSFNVHMRFGWDVPYVTIEIKDKRDLVKKIALLNASSKTWSMQDYVTAWASLEEDYIKLNRYFNIYDLEISDLAAILMGNIAKTDSTTRIIKNGEFRIVNEAQNVEILGFITDMLKIVPRMNRFENRYAVAEYVKFLRSNSKYDKNKHQDFLEKLRRNKDKFILATQEEGKLSELFQKLS